MWSTHTCCCATPPFVTHCLSYTLCGLVTTTVWHILRYTGSFPEGIARAYFQQLMAGLKHCHGHKVAHRDLKPENLLLKSMKDDHELKVADFGFAAHTANNSLATQCGTPNYAAPEILENRQYGCAVDMWSVGVLTFVLLGVKSELNASKAYKIQINFVGGYPPFHDDNEAKLFERIKCAQFNFDPQ